jgi:hypothetical protein
VDIYGSHIVADIHEYNAFLVYLHGMTCRIQTLVTKSRNRPFWCRYHSINERLGDIELNLVAFDEDVYNFRSSNRLEQLIDLYACLVRLDLELATFSSQSLGSLDQVSLRTCKGNRAISVQAQLAHIRMR